MMSKYAQTVVAPIEDSHTNTVAVNVVLLGRQKRH